MRPTNPPQLVFVYNADSGLLHALKDISHKIVSPETYECDLCQLSHGYFSARKEWKDFIGSMQQPCEFLHRDEAAGSYGLEYEFPAVFVKTADEFHCCLTAAQISRCKTTAELIEAVRARCL